MKKQKARAADWPAIAQRVAALIPHARLHPGAMGTAWENVVRARRKDARFRPRWAVAFSGGADSLALLLILWAEGEGRWGRAFTVLHFNHRLRGRAADADEEFCGKVCAALGLKWVAGRWRAPRADASEAEARAARLAFFDRELRRRRLDHLWLGHQQDDIAETMLMRLARGSGAAGLAAPRPSQLMPGGRWHLRPLLSLQKAEIAAALRTAGACWREDASNATDRFFRNRVRHEVLPAWSKAAQRDAIAGAARSRELLEEDDQALEAWLGALLPRIRTGGKLPLAPLIGKPRALWRRALHRWLLAQPLAGDLSRAAVDALLDAILRGPTRQSAGRAGFAVSDGRELRFQRARKSRS